MTYPFFLLFFSYLFLWFVTQSIFVSCFVYSGYSRMYRIDIWLSHASIDDRFCIYFTFYWFLDFWYDAMTIFTKFALFWIGGRAFGESVHCLWRYWFSTVKWWRFSDDSFFIGGFLFLDYVSEILGILTHILKDKKK